MDSEQLIFGSGKILPVDLASEMKNSYIDYAMSVIVSRAIPDVRDGLKPVHRRILYAMDEAGMTPTKPYKKSARIVGEVLGKYHPHGDSSVYDALVRMAQDFSMRYMLADGHGNFGSVDGDPAAAMRYTEVRMSKISELMLQDIDKNTVDFVPNYDESLKEPEVLPSKFPNLLVNGTSGIAVGMATNIPPHNLSEVIDGTLHLIDHPDSDIPTLMRYIKAPDFPTGAQIVGTQGIKDMYTNGRGMIRMRAVTNIESMQNGKSRILVTELPYQVNKARLVEQIADCVRNKIIAGITDLRDESDRDGMRIVIELRRDASAEIVLNQLFKHTMMQETFGANVLALVKGRPKTLNLKQVLENYIDHQREVITRRTKFDLNKAKSREHILLGLTIALDNIDAVIKIIRDSSNSDDARKILETNYQLSEIQSKEILNLRLQRLTSLEREKISDELKEIETAIKNYTEILSNKNLVDEIIKRELTAVKKDYGDSRRTQIVADYEEFVDEDLIPEEDIVVTMTHIGYIKRIPLDTYRKQKRGGRGVTGMETKDNDFVEHLMITTTHHTILFLTNRGRVYYLKAHGISESSRTAKGTAIVNLIPIEKGEIITAVIPVREFDPTRFLVMITKKGIVKKSQLSLFKSLRRVGLKAINLDEDDELIGVKFTDGSNDIILGTSQGKSIIFSEKDVRPMGRSSRGVKAITLKSNDFVIGMDKIKPDCDVLTITAEGYGKRSSVDEYRKQKRGGTGIINLKVTEKTGDVVGIKLVRSDQELMLITTGGIVIRTNVSDISVIGRNTQGVKIMKTDADDRVASFATVDQKDDSKTETEVEEDSNLGLDFENDLEEN